MAEPEYFSWHRNTFQVKDPEALTYSGNVIGNVSKEERITEIFTSGNAFLSELNEIGGTFTEQIAPSAAKYSALWNIVNSVNTAIMNYFGNE